eukprot:g7433.t1
MSFEHEVWNLKRKKPSPESGDTALCQSKQTTSESKDDAKIAKEGPASLEAHHGDMDEDADKRAGRRIILLFDMWHPELEKPECEAISQLFDSTLRAMHKQ